jgi:hypothetical protein
MKPHASGFITILSLVAFSSCTFPGRAVGDDETKPVEAGRSAGTAPRPPNPGKLIHVVVALCDNQYQGIVPVPSRIGNGDDPGNNLYWGAGYGVKTFYRRSPDWNLIMQQPNPKPAVLERLVFKHRQRSAFIVADAYRGREIRRCTVDFLNYAAGRNEEEIDAGGSSGLKMRAGGGADLVAYVGHNGLMDFTLSDYPRHADTRERSVIILACASRAYFAEAVRAGGATPLLWTTGLMAPEAYVLKAAVDGWLLSEPGPLVRQRAARAYAG